MDSAARFGFFAVLGALIASVAYGVPQILQVLGLLPTPVDRILIFAPSLALAPLFVLAMAALHHRAAPQRAVFSLAALALAIMYAALVSIVYIVQLGVVIPSELRDTADEFAAFACCDPGAPMTVIDLLGYTLMCLATLIAAPAIEGPGHARGARLWFVANGLLAPFILLQLLEPRLIWVGALWLITFPVAMLLLALVFVRGEGAR
jgi:hypothetical protein